MLEQKDQNSETKNKKTHSDLGKYSAIGFQMIAIIVIGVLGGMKLDQLMSKVDFPVFTMVLTISSVIFAIYYAIKDFLKPNKE